MQITRTTWCLGKDSRRDVSKIVARETELLHACVSRTEVREQVVSASACVCFTCACTKHMYVFSICMSCMLSYMHVFRCMSCIVTVHRRVYKSYEEEDTCHMRRRIHVI